MPAKTLLSIRRLQVPPNRSSLAPIQDLVERVCDLQTHIDRLEERLTCIEAELALLYVDEEAACELIHSLERMEQATRAALRNLYDPGRLANSELASLLVEVNGRALTGHELQALLRNAIDMLKPAQTLGQQSRSHCCYDVLALTYIEGQSVAEIMSGLAISRRQYYRELKIAVRAAAHSLFFIYPTSRI